MNPLYNGWIRRHRGNRTRRAARRRGAATRPSRTSSGRGSRTSGGQDPRWGTEELATGSTCSAASSSASAGGGSGATGRSPTAATASSTRTRARPGAARPASATRPGRRRSWRRSRAIALDDATIGAGRRGPRLGPPPGRRSTGPGSSARSASSRWSTPPAASSDDGLPRRGCTSSASQRTTVERTSADGIPAGARASSGSGRCRRRGGRPTCPAGEGRPAPRHLRADHRRRERDRVGQAHAGGLRARIGARAARKGCNGAPDRIRTCDLRLRRPTLYPLSYRRAGRRWTSRGARIPAPQLPSGQGDPSWRVPGTYLWKRYLSRPNI